MDSDFNVCPRNTCRRHAGDQVRGSESAGIVQRLDELMRRCREDGHRPTYQDLQDVRNGGAGAPAGGTVRHHQV